MEKLIQALTFFLTFLLLVNPVVAQLEWGEWWSFEYFWTKALALPDEWMPSKNMRLFIFNFLVPFIALFAILLGLLRNLGIFAHTTGIQGVIAFAMAFMTLPSKIFINFVSFTLGLAGMWGYVVFLAMFIVGSALYGGGFLYRKAGEAGMYATYKRERDRLDRELASTHVAMQTLYGQLATARPGEIANLRAKLKDLQKRREELELRKQQMKLAYEEAR